MIAIAGLLLIRGLLLFGIGGRIGGWRQVAGCELGLLDLRIDQNFSCFGDFRLFCVETAFNSKQLNEDLQTVFVTELGVGLVLDDLKHGAHAFEFFAAYLLVEDNILEPFKNKGDTWDMRDNLMVGDVDKTVEVCCSYFSHKFENVGSKFSSIAVSHGSALRAFLPNIHLFKLSLFCLSFLVPSLLFVLPLILL